MQKARKQEQIKADPAGNAESQATSRAARRQVRIIMCPTHDKEKDTL